MLTFVCIPLSGSGVVKIAWLAPSKLYYFFNASTSLGAIAYALDEIKADPNLLPGYDFQYVFCINL